MVLKRRSRIQIQNIIIQKIALLTHPCPHLPKLYCLFNSLILHSFSSPLLRSGFLSPSTCTLYSPNPTWWSWVKKQSRCNPKYSTFPHIKPMIVSQPHYRQLFIHIDGTFPEKAISNTHLSFADQGQQISVFCFRFQQTNGSFLFQFSVCTNKRYLPFSHSYPYRLRKHRDGDMETWRNGEMKTWTWRHQTETQAIFLNPFTAFSSCKRKVVVFPFVH
jgi:hypothetical protein